MRFVFHAAVGAEQPKIWSQGKMGIHHDTFWFVRCFSSIVVQALAKEAWNRWIKEEGHLGVMGLHRGSRCLRDVCLPPTWSLTGGPLKWRTIWQDPHPWQVPCSLVGTLDLRPNFERYPFLRASPPAFLQHRCCADEIGPSKVIGSCGISACIGYFWREVQRSLN